VAVRNSSIEDRCCVNASNSQSLHACASVRLSASIVGGEGVGERDV